MVSATSWKRPTRWGPGTPPARTPATRGRNGCSRGGSPPNRRTLTGRSPDADRRASLPALAGWAKIERWCPSAPAQDAITRAGWTVQMQDDASVHWPREIPELIIARLQLRAVHPARDAAAMLGLLSDPEVTRYSNSPSCTTLAEAQAALEQIPRRFAAKEMIRWAIQPLGHDEAIGTVGLVRVNHEHGRGDLGYDLARRWWGRGWRPRRQRPWSPMALRSWGCTASRRGRCRATTPRRGCWRSWGFARKARCATTSAFGGASTVADSSACSPPTRGKGSESSSVALSSLCRSALPGRAVG